MGGGAADGVALNEAIPEAPYAGFLEPNPDPILYGFGEPPPGLSCDDEEGGGGTEVARLVGGVVER